MNNSISNPVTNSTWKRAKAQYISVACGLALSLSALAALAGGVGKHTQLTRSLSTPAVAGSATSLQSTPQVVFYMVGSEAQAARVRANEELAQWVHYDASVSEPNRSVVILNAGTTNEAAQARAFIDNAMAASNFVSDMAPSFQIVDMRD